MAKKKEIKYIREQFLMSEEDDANYNTVHLPTKNGYGIYKEFLFLNQFALYDIVKNYNLSKNGFKIFLFLLSKVSIGNCIYTYLDEICLELVMNKGNVSRELKKLSERNIIIRKSRFEGNRRMQMQIAFNFDRLNSNIGYKGKLKTSRVKELQQNDEPILSKDCIRMVSEVGSVTHVQVDTGLIIWQTGDKIENSQEDIAVKKQKLALENGIKKASKKSYINQTNLFGGVDKIDRNTGEIIEGDVKK